MKYNYNILRLFCVNKCWTLEREYHYVPGRKFRADYAIPEIRMLIEIQGGVYTRRAHGSITGILKDMERQNQATIHGWLRLVYTPKEFKKGQPIIDLNKFVEGRNEKN